MAVGVQLIIWLKCLLESLLCRAAFLSCSLEAFWGTSKNERLNLTGVGRGCWRSSLTRPPELPPYKVSAILHHRVIVSVSPMRWGIRLRNETGQIGKVSIWTKGLGFFFELKKLLWWLLRSFSWFVSITLNSWQQLRESLLVLDDLFFQTFGGTCSVSPFIIA